MFGKRALKPGVYPATIVALENGNAILDFDKTRRTIVPEFEGMSIGMTLDISIDTTGQSSIPDYEINRIFAAVAAAKALAEAEAKLAYAKTFKGRTEIYASAAAGMAGVVVGKTISGTKIVAAKVIPTVAYGTGVAAKGTAKGLGKLCSKNTWGKLGSGIAAGAKTISASFKEGMNS